MPIPVGRRSGGRELTPFDDDRDNTMESKQYVARLDTRTTSTYNDNDDDNECTSTYRGGFILSHQDLLRVWIYARQVSGYNR